MQPKLPELKLPKLDLSALSAAQKANLAATLEAQTVLVDAFQAIAKTQYGYAEQLAAQVKSALPDVAAQARCGCRRCQGLVPAHSTFRYSSNACFSLAGRLVPYSWPQRLLPELRALQSVVTSVWPPNLVCSTASPTFTVS